MSAVKKSFLIAFVYVILATIYSQCYWSGAMMLHGFLSTFLFYFFLPAAFVPMIIKYAEREPFLMILVAQLITFFILWLLLFFIVKLIESLRSKRK